MRRDMFKIIVERPRFFPPGGSTRGRTPRSLEEAPGKQGIRRRHKERTSKQLNDNLAPLRRYLLKQVGRPWNKVFSEICRDLRVDSAVQRHLRVHLDDYVAIQGRDGKRILYVDRRTGLLRRTKTIPAKHPSRTLK